MIMNDNTPYSITETNPDGTYDVSYFLNGMRHTTTEPSIWYKQDTNKPFMVAYYRNGMLHRADGPARIGYYDDGSIREESYLVDGCYHRIDGPAVTIYYDDATVYEEHYYLTGERCDSLEHLQQRVKEFEWFGTDYTQEQ